MMTINDWETQTQADMFDHYLETTADPVVRTLHGRGYSYEECEWHAYQHGWNAAKLYFTVEGQAL
jgi:hypothetical protein